MLLAEARDIAEGVVALLAPACDRIEIAGSVRRGKAEPGDLEIVCLPIPRLDLLGEPAGNTLDAAVSDAMAREPRLVWDDAKKRRGAKYKRFWWTAGIGIDLFVADARNYGNTLAIRTGDADFSRLCVTQRIHGGLMRPTMRQRDGYLWAQGDGDAHEHLVPCPDEASFFAALGVHPVPAPRERDAACIARLRRAWA